MFTNRAQRGFFYSLNIIHRVMCPYVPCECKNYSEDPANPELDQLTGRFSIDRGQFGILVCRSVADKELMLKRCKDAVSARKGFVLVLDDDDIETLLRLRVKRDEVAIDVFLDERFTQLVM